MPRLDAPWTPEQVAAIEAYQKRDDAHPFTCPDHSDRPLSVLPGFLYCAVHDCAYTQRWVHDWMAGVKR